MRNSAQTKSLSVHQMNSRMRKSFVNDDGVVKSIAMVDNRWFVGLGNSSEEAEADLDRSINDYESNVARFQAQQAESARLAQQAESARLAQLAESARLAKRKKVIDDIAAVVLMFILAGITWAVLSI